MSAVFTVVGAWALPPSIILFVFYARVSQVVTRYASDFYPAVAAACLCVGMAVVDAVRRRAPTFTGSARLAIAGGVALYMASERGWAFMWHSHNEREITTNNVFPGGMLMMMLVDSREFVIDESL